MIQININHCSSLIHETMTSQKRYKMMPLNLEFPHPNKDQSTLSLWFSRTDLKLKKIKKPKICIDFLMEPFNQKNKKTVITYGISTLINTTLEKQLLEKAKLNNLFPLKSSKNSSLKLNLSIKTNKTLITLNTILLEKIKIKYNKTLI